MPGYFALLALFALLLLLCFSFGLREWLRPRDDRPVPVDVEYVRSENYFGAAFRVEMRKWLATARPVADAGAAGGSLLEMPPGARILVLPGGYIPGNREYQDFVYCQGDLSIPHDTVFHKEIYALGNVLSGAGAKFQSVAADGHIVLGPQTVVAGRHTRLTPQLRLIVPGPKTEVAGWVDSGRMVFLRSGTVVHQRVSAATSIELEPGVFVESLYAPLIFTSGYGSVTEFSAAAAPLEMPAAPWVREAAGKEFAASLDGLAGSRLTPDTLLIGGDLELPDGQSVEGNLIVQGALRCGAGCSFRGSVKATEIQLGPSNSVLGNLVSSGALTVGEQCSVRQNVIAERDVALRSGVRVGTKDMLAAVSTNGRVLLEANVAVCGKIAAGRSVVTL